MSPTELVAGLTFIEEIDRLKGIIRQTFLHDASRQENTAEHSWHLAMATLVMAPLSDEPIDTARAMKMALLHDVVEIDAGDTFIYDVVGTLDKEAREKKAADRLFGLLPSPLNTELRGIWDDFEKQSCPESRFVTALDRMLPILANSRSGGGSWKKHGILKSQAVEKNNKIAKGSKKLWAFSSGLIEDAVRKGYLVDR
ncbi:MAG: HD domain-containing protein [Bdellovibrionota bacterium]